MRLIKCRMVNCLHLAGFTPVISLPLRLTTGQPFVGKDIVLVFDAVCADHRSVRSAHYFTSQQVLDLENKCRQMGLVPQWPEMSIQFQPIRERFGEDSKIYRPDMLKVPWMRLKGL